MWTIEAPACQASMADWAISSGVMGMWGAISRIMRLPVMAAVMMIFSMRYPLIEIRCYLSGLSVTGMGPGFWNAKLGVFLLTALRVLRQAQDGSESW
jgi:hypothetical protein